MNALTVDQVGRSVGRASRTTVFERSPASPSAVAHALGGTTATPFWLDDVRARRVDHEPLAGDVDADLVIVGAGYTGLWTALRAVERQPGLRVVLLEAETVGWAASGRNGGFCEASLTHGDENGRSRWPDEIDTLTRLGLENLDDIEATVRRYGMDVDFERTGILSVAVEPHQVPWIAEPDAEDGHDVFLDESAVRAEIASPTYLAGRWDRRTNAILHPAKLALELARVVVEARRRRARAHSRCAASTTRARAWRSSPTAASCAPTAPCSRRTCSRRC